MSTSRTLLLAAVTALAVMLIAGAGPAAAQSSGTPLTQTVKLTGTAKNGKKFKGTYAIDRFTRSGGKLYAVGTVKGRLKNRRVTREGVRIPVAIQRHEGATTSQLPNPTPGGCQILDLVLQPTDDNAFRAQARTIRSGSPSARPPSSRPARTP